MTDKTVTIVAVGDIGPNRGEPESIFAPNAQLLKAADITFGQMEGILSERGTPNFGMEHIRRSHPDNVSALTYAGFDVVGLASNRTMIFGYDAFFDTIDVLRDNGIQVVGVGNNIEEARKPVILERKGTKVAFLSYNSITMEHLRHTIATNSKPGCNPLRVFTIYEPISFPHQPGTPAKPITVTYPEDRETMIEDIEKAKSQADIVVVNQHAGLDYVHASIAMYQKEIAHAAVAAGADLVIQEHAHMLRGIEIYKGKAIFYGVGNFALDPVVEESKRKTSWSPEAKELYKVGVEPGWEAYPFPAECRKTMAVKCVIQDKNIGRVSFVPCLINQEAQAEILTRQDKRSEEFLRYMEDLCQSQGLHPKLCWEGEEVVVAL